MKVYASKFLEPMSNNRVTNETKWSWSPTNQEVYEIYASGNNTSSNESTYAAEKDNRSDSDRPNEGIMVA
jgi:hypothetical protein